MEIFKRIDILVDSKGLCHPINHPDNWLLKDTVNTQIASCEQQVKDMARDDTKLRKDITELVTRAGDLWEIYNTTRTVPKNMPTNDSLAGQILDLARYHFAAKLVKQEAEINRLKAELAVSYKRPSEDKPMIQES
jgi:hypothetical protein